MKKEGLGQYRDFSLADEKIAYALSKNIRMFRNFIGRQVFFARAIFA
ncbi:MAG: hypothetical protein M1575_03435 [Patescibacteria group bacterium]|nr:hypothetical protein [Patescibacteria group bacterium]MCL5095752.1 hypothetical protein [Patescibacteria group bacterium]